MIEFGFSFLNTLTGDDPIVLAKVIEAFLTGLGIGFWEATLESMMVTPLTRFEIATGTSAAVMEHLGPLLLLPLLIGGTVDLVHQLIGDY